MDSAAKPNLEITFHWFSISSIKPPKSVSLVALPKSSLGEYSPSSVKRWSALPRWSLSWLGCLERSEAQAHSRAPCFKVSLLLRQLPEQSTDEPLLGVTEWGTETSLLGKDTFREGVFRVSQHGRKSRDWNCQIISWWGFVNWSYNPLRSPGLQTTLLSQSYTRAEAATSSGLLPSLSSSLAQMMGALYHSFWCQSLSLSACYSTAAFWFPREPQSYWLLVLNCLSYIHDTVEQGRQGTTGAHLALNITDAKVLSHLLILYTRIQHCLLLCQLHCAFCGPWLKLLQASMWFCPHQKGRVPLFVSDSALSGSERSINTTHDIKRVKRWEICKKRVKRWRYSFWKKKVITKTIALCSPMNAAVQMF